MANNDHPGSPDGGKPMVEIQVVARVRQILDLFSTTRDSIRTADVVAELGLQRPTAHRYLMSMANAHLLERQDDGSMTPGPILMKVGALALGTREVIHLARPFMQRLAAETRQTAVLSLWGGQGPVVAAVEEDRTRDVRVTVSTGYALRLDAAQSAVFLAHLPDQVLAQRLIHQMPAYLAAEVQAQVDGVGQHGVVVHTEEVEGIRVVATPVFDRDGICAALALLGTTAGIPADRNSAPARTLKRASVQMSHDLQAAHPEASEPPATGGAAAG